VGGVGGTDGGDEVGPGGAFPVELDGQHRFEGRSLLG
jgi:hypothetical protein